MARPKRTCTEDGCDKAHRARGLCSTHYNAHHLPNRHPKVSVTCDCCGNSYERDARKVERYGGRFCSLACRDFTRSGKGTSHRIPSDHWARWFGATSAWTPPTSRPVVDCAWCGVAFTQHSATNRFCSHACNRKAKRVRRRGKEHEAAGEYSWAQLVDLWVKFDGACAYCAKPIALADTQAEHVIALSNGGANNTTNLLPSCGPCNSDKRDLTLTAWASDRERRNLPPVTTQWPREDRRYAHLVIEWTSVRA